MKGPLSLSSPHCPNEDEVTPGGTGVGMGEDEAACPLAYRYFYQQGLCYLKVDRVAT